MSTLYYAHGGSPRYLVDGGRVWLVSSDQPERANPNTLGGSRSAGAVPRAVPPHVFVTFPQKTGRTEAQQLIIHKINDLHKKMCRPVPNTYY